MVFSLHRFFNHHCSLNLGHFHYLKRNLYPLAFTSNLPSANLPHCQPQTTINLLSVFTELLSLDISYKWGHGVRLYLVFKTGFLYVAYCWFIHLCKQLSALHSFDLPNSILLNRYATFVYSFSSCWKLGCVLFWLWH